MNEPSGLVRDEDGQVVAVQSGEGVGEGMEPVDLLLPVTLLEDHGLKAVRKEDLLELRQKLIEATEIINSMFIEG